MGSSGETGVFSLYLKIFISAGGSLHTDVEQRHAVVIHTTQKYKITTPGPLHGLGAALQNETWKAVGREGSSLK